MKIIKAVSKEHVDFVRELFMEYADSLGFELNFQDFERELKELPGKYAPPDGCMLLGIIDNQIAGCVALRKITEDVCEMKRLYARHEFRGKGMGKALGKAIIEEGSRIGYKSMRLDTISFMKEAIALYKKLGFEEIDPYTYNPIEGAKYMELILK